jgi:hypothetical protein
MQSTIFRPGGNQNLTISGDSVAGTPFSAQISKVRLCATVACYVTFSGNAATANDMLVPANFPEKFTVSAGQTPRVIQFSGVGLLSITELTQ